MESKEDITIKKEEWDKVQAQIKMLEAVADKGRVFNYQTSNSPKKPIKIKLSVYQEKLIVGWKTLEDSLIKNPTTGLTVGEVQRYEIKLLDKTGEESLIEIVGYPAFSAARYNERVECEVQGKKEDYDGKVSYDVILPDGRTISLQSQFIN